MKRTAIAGLIVGMIGLAAGSVLAQAGAKAIFYGGSGATVPAKPAAPGPVAAPASAPKDQYMGVSYWIELVGGDGQSRRVTADHVFRSGDRIRLHLRSNRAGYLYVANIGSTGRTYMLFPNATVEAGNNTVQADVAYTVPSGGYIRFDQNPGEETLLVMLSSRPMDGMAPQPDRQTAAITSEDAARLLMGAKSKGAKDLVLETDAASSEPASYAVAPLQSLNDGAIITMRIKLKHQ